MAPGNNGASTTPEDDDPFGYLYADGQAAGATPPNSGGGGYGYPNPRSSYHQVRPVGERQYGQQQQYGQQVPQQQPQTAVYNNQPDAYYQAPETLPGGAPGQPGPPQAPGHGGGRGSGGRGPNTKALLIGAVAVVAAVVIGIGVAMLGNGTDDDKGGDAGGKPSGDSQTVQPSESASASASADPVDLPKTDAKVLQLNGGTTLATDVPGAKADGGQYVAGFNAVGASVTWTVSDIPKDAAYSLHVRYSVPGEDGNATMTVNGTKQSRPLSMKNYAHAEKGKWEKGWTDTWGVVQLTKGTNAIALSCEQGNQCNALIDQMYLVEGTKG
ncbi:carbohydrate-binding protein [Streptomyces sp. NPDC050095]|uniref:carbohydrate-binding protein n=1 Tax=unclassified Streptomyces TaxID=2593676 RepID=UPI00343AEDF5